ncbi:hypothetical protein CAEBREN_01591 [Caenorhabditis brenneri]|uniref:Uncharacterized protein n=1 Tax=Caenorhabditis brenneri TaxID=135651 RepID=G0MQI8_CAEBE|nr:hypothetical protein CAEBREN_01591 [Caenorhabditis brenneri]
MKLKESKFSRKAKFFKLGANNSNPVNTPAPTSQPEMDIMSQCGEAAKFRIAFYEKIKAGWTSQSLEDTKMVHYLYRIFYMAPSDQEVQAFEWHNFFDTHHDFPMRVHIDNSEDHKKCATMADIIIWFTKPENARKALRRMGNDPHLIYCLGCKTVEEKEFLSLMTLQKMQKTEKSTSPAIQPVSTKAAKTLGMSTLEMADAAFSGSNQQNKQVENKLLTSVIGLPLRRSASALLFPVSDLLEQHCVKEPESVITDLSMWQVDKAASSFDLNATDQPKRKTTKATFFPAILMGDASKKEPENPNWPHRKNGTVDTPILKQSEAHKKSIARRKRHGEILENRSKQVSSSWFRTSSESK